MEARIVERRMSADTWASLKMSSHYQFPELEEEAALVEYVKRYHVKDVFWIDSNGTRCKWGPGKLSFQ
jgi:hypothetical protein